MLGFVGLECWSKGNTLVGEATMLKVQCGKWGHPYSKSIFPIFILRNPKHGTHWQCNHNFFCQSYDGKQPKCPSLENGEAISSLLFKYLVGSLLYGQCICIVHHMSGLLAIWGWPYIFLHRKETLCVVLIDLREPNRWPFNGIFIMTVGRVQVSL